MGIMFLAYSFLKISKLSRYLTRTINVFDTSTSENASVEVDVAQLNIAIKLEGEDTSGFTLIPFAKVLECSETGEVMLDRSFIPACLHYGASQLLVERLKEIQPSPPTVPPAYSNVFKPDKGKRVRSR